MKKYPVYLLIFVLCTFKLQAQDLNGHWYGVGIVNSQGNNNNSYLSELVLTQKGKQINGELNFYFRDSLFSNKIVGTYDVASRKLLLKQTNIIFHKATSTVLGVDCPMTGEFILRIAKAESVLTGWFVSTKDFRFTCPPINFKLKKSADTVGFARTKELLETEDTIAKKIAPIITQEEKDKAAVFAARSKNYIREIEVNSSNVRIELYDNGAIDYDSVTVFFNNKIVVLKSKLDYTAIRANLVLDDSLEYNELSMFAENEGLVPPNTAMLIIYDGSTRHDVLLTSDLKNNATVRIRRRK